MGWWRRVSDGFNNNKLNSAQHWENTSEIFDSHFLFFAFSFRRFSTSNHQKFARNSFQNIISRIFRLFFRLFFLFLEGEKNFLKKGLKMEEA